MWFNTCELFTMGMLSCYADKPQTMDNMEANIRRIIVKKIVEY